MTRELTQYLESIRIKARLDNNDEPTVMSELEAHIEDKLQELTKSGLSEEEAIRTCIWQMGSIKQLARQIYEAYSQGTWRQAVMAALPHFLFGLIFIMNLWQFFPWLTAALVLTLGITIYGWLHGKPAWAFPWMGYSLMPIIAAGILLISTRSSWTYAGIIIYFPIAIWWILRVVVQATRKDWLLSTMMLLPIPIIVGWYLAACPTGKLNDASLERVNTYAPWIGMSFMMLAFTIGAFLRVRQRNLRVVLLSVSGLLILTMAVFMATRQLDKAYFFWPLLGMWGILVIPPILERQLKNSRRLAKKHQDFQDTDGLPAG